MASGTKAKKHKCSCGRSFRHAISLKRHQNVTGCAPAEAGEEAAAAPEAPAAVATEEKSAEKPAKSAARRKSSAPKAKPAPAQDDRTIVITPELVAAWQEQTGFQHRPRAVVDAIAPQPSAPKVDWVALAQTGKEFASFCGEVKNGAVSTAKSTLLFLSRAVLFCSVVLVTGWLLVSSVSASSAHSTDRAGHAQLAAQSVVQNFLQNAKLNHYNRARRLLAPGARESVTSQQLQMMFNSLPLDVAPTAWSTELSNDGKAATVVVRRDGMNEVYTLVHGETGWGLASVAVANS